MHVTIIIQRHIFYFVYLCSCQGLGLFMSYLCDLFFILASFSLPFNHITLLKQRHLVFVHILECLLIFLDNIVDEEGKNFLKVKVQPHGGA